MAENNLALTEGVYYILLSLQTPLHGYGIMQNIERLSQGRISIAPGTLYGALENLQKKAWISALPGEGGTRKKEYVITPLGMDILQKELLRLEELYHNGKSMLGGFDYD